MSTAKVYLDHLSPTQRYEETRHATYLGRSLSEFDGAFNCRRALLCTPICFRRCATASTVSFGESLEPNPSRRRDRGMEAFRSLCAPMSIVSERPFTKGPHLEGLKRWSPPVSLCFFSKT